MATKKKTTGKGSTVKKTTTGDAIFVPMPVLVDVASVNFAVYNPRTIKPAMIASLKESISHFGFVTPLVIQKKGNTLVAGHQRIKALKELCIERGIAIPQLPALILDLTDREAKKLNFALNRISGDFDAALVAQLLADIGKEKPIVDDELVSMGLSSEDVSKFLKMNDGPGDGGGSPTFGKSVTLSLAFDDVKKRDALKKLLDERAKIAEKRTGDIVFEALQRAAKKK